jgi:dihydroorotase
VDDDEKLLPFAEASPGATGLELLLSLTLKWAEDYAASRTRGARPLSRALARITSEAARVRPGRRHAVGWRGGRRGAVRRRRALDGGAFALASQGKHTPFLGYNWRARCKPPSWPATLLTNADTPA